MEKWSSKLDFREIGERYGTPIYVFNTRQLKQNFDDYLEVVNQPQNIAYAVKANPSMAVLRRLCNFGGSADCSAASEIRMSYFAGFNPSNIIYNSPALDINEAVNLLIDGGTIVIDSVELLKDMESALSGITYKGKLFVRVSPEVSLEYANKEDWQQVVNHGSKTSKFGIPSEELPQILNDISLKICGLHIHVGSQMDNVNQYINAVNFLHDLVDKIHQNTQQVISFIDIGGGLGVRYTSSENYPSIKQLASSLTSVKRDSITYVTEPGNSMVCNTMGIVSKVIGLKNMRQKKWAILDVGADQLATVVFVKLFRQILNEEHVPLPFRGEDSIGGPLCFSGDTLLPKTHLGDMVKRGDYVFIQHCGAYCYSMSSKFNGRQFVGMVKVEEDNSIELCNISENENLNSVYTTYQWGKDVLK